MEASTVTSSRSSIVTAAAVLVVLVGLHVAGGLVALLALSILVALLLSPI